MKICFVITAEVFDLCDKRREPRKKRFEYEGPEKHKEVNNNIKKCTKKAKENRIREQCSETEGNLRKNNSKRAYPLVKDLTTVKQGKATTVQDRENASQKYDRYRTNGQNTALSCPIARPMEIHQY